MADAKIYETAERDPEGFWASYARELEWSRPWDRVLDWQPPHARWFSGGKLNVSVNCVDRHLNGSRAAKAAIVWEGEPGDQRTLTYQEQRREVSRCANVFRQLGVAKGDRVALYMPMVPELAIAVHSSQSPTLKLVVEKAACRNGRCTTATCSSSDNPMAIHSH